MEAQADDFRDEFWRTHILKAQEFLGSNQEYCKANGLQKSTFHVHKRRLGFTKPFKKKRSVFVKVAPVLGRPEKPVKIQQARLPNPKWVAEFIMAMLGER